MMTMMQVSLPRAVVLRNEVMARSQSPLDASSGPHSALWWTATHGSEELLKNRHQNVLIAHLSSVFSIISRNFIN